MALDHLQTGGGEVRPFSESGYEILDEDLATHGEVVIWSNDVLTPRLGQLFNVESSGVVHELAVYALTTFKGGWSARCRLEAPSRV